MEQDTLFQDEHGQVRERWLWIGALVLAFLVFSCLALMTINSGPGWGPEGMKTHYQLGNTFTDFPDCPAEVLCSVPRVDPRNIHWVLWIDVEKQTLTGVETLRHKLIDVPLFW